MPAKPNPSDDPAALRRRAEARLRDHRQGQRSRAGDPESAADPQRQFHELEVHQVELEMQNAELQAARNRTEILLEKYTDLYDFAPVGYFSLDESGRINEANLTGAALLGVERSRLLNQSLLHFVAAASRPDMLGFLKQVWASPGKQICTVALVNVATGEFWARVVGNAALTANAAGKCCRVAVSDISLLKRAEEAQDRLAAIVESSDDAIISKDLNGIVTSWNQGAEKIFGYPAREMLGTSIKRLIPADRQTEEDHILSKIRRGKSVQHFDTVRQTRDGRLIDVSVTISPIKDVAGRVIGVSKTARDIRRRKLAEKILRQNEALFSGLVAQAPVGVYVVDDQLRLRQMNRKARPIFRHVRPWQGRELPGIMQTLWPRKVAAEIVARFRHTLLTGQPYYATKFSERRRDIAVTESYEWQLQRVTLPHGGHGVVCFFENLTERKRIEETRRRLAVLTASNRKLEAEILRRQALEASLRQSERDQRKLLVQSRDMQEQLRQLSRQILQAQEEERKRISRELHDVIAQTLTGINLELTALKKAAAINVDHLDRNITRTQRRVEESVSIVHEFARELRPAVLDDLGLIPALHSFVESFSKRTRVHVRLKVFAGVERLANDQRTVLYRVAQEALTNVARHAHASRVDVNIRKLPGRISMTIRDDGKSFAVARLLDGKGSKRLGLLGMRERLEMVGGNFNVMSAPGQGTTVEAQLPFKHGNGV